MGVAMLMPAPGEPAQARPVAVAAVAAGDFRQAMAQLAGGVCIVTTDGPAGRAGFTASSVCSVSDEPPMLLVCIKRTASAYPAFQGNGELCVNVLTTSQQALAALFGGKTAMAERFASGPWVAGAGQAPALQGALAAVHCRIEQRCSAGSHDVLICQVIALSTPQPGHALVYFNRGYHALPGTAPA